MVSRTDLLKMWTKIFLMLNRNNEIGVVWMSLPSFLNEQRSVELSWRTYFPVNFYWLCVSRKVQKCTLLSRCTNCILMVRLSPESVFLPAHNSHERIVYSVCVCMSVFVSLLMHEWVMVTGLLVRQALWHYDRMRSARCRMTRSPRQPHTHTRTHTHFTMSLNKSVWIMVMPLAVKHCPTLKHTHKHKAEDVYLCSKQLYGYVWVLAESHFKKSLRVFFNKIMCIVSRVSFRFNCRLFDGINSITNTAKEGPISHNIWHPVALVASWEWS